MDDPKCLILSDEFYQYDLSFKIIVIGNSGVGKSCLALKATKNKFLENHQPTVGVEFFIFNVRVNDKNIKLQIWDTCGQEIYKSLVMSFYKNSSLAVIVYAVDDERSFKDVENWLNEIKTHSNPDIKVFLIGNKTDLEDRKKVPFDVAKEFADKFKFNYFVETSAKTGFNTQNVFVKAAQLLYEEQLKYMTKNSFTETEVPIPYTGELNSYILGDSDEPRSRGCCG